MAGPHFQLAVAAAWTSLYLVCHRVSQPPEGDDWIHEVKFDGYCPRKFGSKAGNVAATFERWIGEGFFDEPRTVLDVLKRFRKEAIMVPRTSLPAYFLAAVRKGRLKRDEVQANGRTVWAYTTAASGKAKVN